MIENSKHFALLTPLTLGFTTLGGRTLTVKLPRLIPTITRLSCTLLSITPTVSTNVPKFMTSETTFLA